MLGSLQLSGCNSSQAASPRVFTENEILGSWGFSATANIVNNVPNRCPSGISGISNLPCNLVAVGIFSFRSGGKCSLNVRMGVYGLTLPPHDTGAAASTDPQGGVCDHEVRDDGTGRIKEIFLVNHW